MQTLAVALAMIATACTGDKDASGAALAVPADPAAPDSEFDDALTVYARDREITEPAEGEVIRVGFGSHS